MVDTILTQPVLNCYLQMSVPFSTTSMMGIEALALTHVLGLAQACCHTLLQLVDCSGSYAPSLFTLTCLMGVMDPVSLKFW